MGLLAEALSERSNTPAGRPRCTVAQLIDRLNEEDGADLADALASPMLATVIAEEVERVHGVHISGTTMARHRRGACSCGRAR